MNYLSTCSGIEAASVAWEPLGWNPVAFAEIEKFPSAVLAHRFPETSNLGDMTKYHEWGIRPDTVDLLVGGTPCQSFSVAGLRKGLRDPRGNLTLTFLGLVEAFDPRCVLWENVPGVLSDRGNAFGQFLWGLGQLGYEYAYRVLDAQYFGVPQRRRRVFVVASPRGCGIHPGKILFEPEGLCRDLAPSREAGEGIAEGVAGCLGGSSQSGGFRTTDIDNSGAFIPEIANPLTARMHKGINTTLDEGQTPIPVPIAYDTTQVTNATNRSNPQPGDPCHPLAAGAHPPAICTNQFLGVRRLTPRECERLQGFPDDWTLIPWRGKSAEECPDGPRYKALGNSMAVPVMRWIGERIQQTLT